MRDNELINLGFLTYSELRNELTRQISISDVSVLNEIDRKRYDLCRLNYQRTTRLEKTFIPEDETIQIFSLIDKIQTWVVITETWCGDSAQNIPVIAKLARLSDKINLKFVLRELNPEFMNTYLTNGARSIPKLIAFDDNEKEIFCWGPRPEAAQKIYADLKSTGLEKSFINKELHFWYGRNRGKEVEREIKELIEKILSASTVKL